MQLEETIDVVQTVEDDLRSTVSNVFNNLQLHDAFLLIHKATTPEVVVSVLVVRPNIEVLELLHDGEQHCSNNIQRSGHLLIPDI